MDELERIFKEFLDLPSDVDLSALRYGETEGWDSLVHMALVAEIEDSFGIMLDTDDVIGMSGYIEAVEIVKRYSDGS